MDCFALQPQHVDFATIDQSTKSKYPVASWRDVLFSLFFGGGGLLGIFSASFFNVLCLAPFYLSFFLGPFAILRGVPAAGL